VLVVHALRGSGPVNEAREEIIARLVAAVDEGRAESTRARGCSELTAEGVVGATLAILYGRLARGSRESMPLTELLGELTGTVLLPYLGSAAARREQARPAPVNVETVTGTSPTATHDGDPLQGLSMRLTYRTARVLEGVTRRPGASNRQLADFAGIQDQGQVSKLLARLESLGLLCNQSQGRAKGEPNRWTLTHRGELVARSIASPAIDGGAQRQVA
jgi:DNA-binding MarR family transcriptional regulator